MNEDYIGEIAGAPIEEKFDEQSKSRIDGIGENFVVELFNPLTVAFRVKYARSIPQAFSMTEEEKKAAEYIGAAITRQDSQAHSIQYLILKPGETMRLPGNVAQVATRQLVTEILQRRQQRNKIADPFARRQVEDEIIISVKPMMDWVNQPSPQEAFDQKLAELNNPDSKLNMREMLQEEQAFPSERVNNESTTKEPLTTLSENTNANGTGNSRGESGTGTTAVADSSSTSETQRNVTDSPRRGRPSTK